MTLLIAAAISVVLWFILVRGNTNYPSEFVTFIRVVVTHRCLPPAIGPEP